MLRFYFFISTSARVSGLTEAFPDDKTIVAAPIQARLIPRTKRYL